ncbi:P2X purinoceptor 7-like [Acyrthosiphon pisum]|uniref:P2X purinoreceptor 7 intracellular domain-containing protein n=1 Tax=Acyrthosiphon pisum TaxID=7029 RepID=A0A8R2BBE6_ACYPI|nr:P2X purinoceptor 7-like [Acyrthosiphon pisum]|eukprot:XP_008189958.1 PREDICTED: P2X purinoceptor 7-like [Acyrthosiphon pisum]
MSLIPLNFDPDIEGIDRYLQEDDDDPVAVNYEGRLNNSNWCSCGYCKGMLSDIKCLCCNELPNLEKIREQEGKCITLHQSINKKKLGQHHPENKMWRCICYKQYTSWVNSWIAMGKGNRVVLPACVVQKIRKEYPEPNGIYVGFKNSKKLPT